jgi:hypothetical protein
MGLTSLQLYKNGSHLFSIILPFPGDRRLVGDAILFSPRENCNYLWLEYPKSI